MPRKPRVSETIGTNENVIETVRTRIDLLRKSDRKVAEVVLDNPRRILHATLAETAEWASVSQPTVIRFCTSIGCLGYQDFKLRLAQSLALGTPATHSVIMPSDSPEEVAEKIFDYTITSLDWVRSRLDGEASASMLANNAGWDSFDPFFHTPCKTCRVQPLCTGGCPWESRKQGPEETGDCTPLRFNLADELRIYHLERSIHRSLPEAFEESELPCQ